MTYETGCKTNGVIPIDYRDVMKDIDRLARDGWRKTTLVHADGYDVFALHSSPEPSPIGESDGESPTATGVAGGSRIETGTEVAAGHGVPPGPRTGSEANAAAGPGVETEGVPRLLITAGIHGEEPASVLGAMRWLVSRSAEWRAHIDMTVIPCINPWGFERGIRFGPHGLDLNREFDAPKHPFTQAVTDFLKGRRFHLFMDQHEDCDFEAMYAYESGGETTPTLGRRILDLAREWVPLSDHEEVGPFHTEDGLIATGRVQTDLEDLDLGDLEGLPIALYVFLHHAPHVVTVETPGLQPLELRIKLHVEALEEACRYLVSTRKKPAKT